MFHVRIHSGYPPNVTNSLQQPHWMRYPNRASDESAGDSIAEGIGSPRGLNATVGRSACRYTRVANLYPHGYQQDGQRPVNFRILDGLKSVENQPFSITPGEGILYVSNPETLVQLQYQSSFELKIEWELEPISSSSSRRNGSAVFRIDVLDSSNHLADSSAASVGCDSGLYCAKFRTETGCNQAAGSVATDRRGCAWRRNENHINSLNNNGPSRMYQTCSPDLSTCPDG